MEEKYSPQIVSQETGHGVATIRNIIKEKGGKLPSRYTHTFSKGPSNKPESQEQQPQPQQQQQQQQQQQLPPNQQVQVQSGAPPITGPGQRFQRPPYMGQHQMGGQPRPNMPGGFIR